MKSTFLGDLNKRGNKMEDLSNTIKNVYMNCRKECGLTREAAAEQMNMPSRRLEKIETFNQDATPLDVKKMAACYKEPKLLNYYCAHECDIGIDTIPEIATTQLERIILETISSLNEINPQANRLMQIARDGKITDDEIEDFGYICCKLEEITIAIDSLNLWVTKTKLNNGLNSKLLEEVIEKYRKKDECK